MTLIHISALLGTVAMACALSSPADAGTSVRSGAQPPITTAWLIGTWGSARGKSTIIGECETDSVVTFKRDGTFHDGGEYGRFRADAVHITYYNRVLFDEADDTEDRSQYSRPKVRRIERVNRNAFREDGYVLVRCRQ